MRDLIEKDTRKNHHFNKKSELKKLTFFIRKK